MVWDNKKKFVRKNVEKFKKYHTTKLIELNHELQDQY